MEEGVFCLWATIGGSAMIGPQLHWIDLGQLQFASFASTVALRAH
jgi:hypothetical protein